MSRILKYNEAKFKLIQLFTSSSLDVGEKLPPEKELVEQIGLGIAPVRHALNELAELGVIRKVNGVGSFLCRKMEKKEQPECKLGVISIASVNEVASKVHGLMKQYRGTYRIFYVSSTPDNETIKEIRTCDHFILIGYVNDLWINLVKGLGKPVVQLGKSPGTSEKITMVDFDYESGIRQSIEKMTARGFRRFGLAAAHPSRIAYTSTLVDIFLRETERNHLDASLRDIYLPSPVNEFADLMKFAAQQQDEYDVLFVEFSILWTFTMHYWNSPHIRAKNIILIENSGRLMQDFENLSSWGIVKFKEDLYEKAVRMLYEAPVSQLEQNKSYLSEPSFCGPVFNI